MTCKDRLAHFQEQHRLETFKQRFYVDILPTLKGSTFESPREYGHATYEIIGDHQNWRMVKDAVKIYFHVTETGEIFCAGDLIDTRMLCVAVVRQGGYNGPADPDRCFEHIMREAIRPLLGEDA